MTMSFKIATENLMAELATVPHEEDYADFVGIEWMDSESEAPPWSTGKKKRGEGGDFDEKLILGIRQELREVLDDFPLRDVFNCDEVEFAARYHYL